MTAIAYTPDRHYAVDVDLPPGAVVVARCGVVVVVAGGDRTAAADRALHLSTRGRLAEDTRRAALRAGLHVGGEL